MGKEDCGPSSDGHHMFVDSARDDRPINSPALCAYNFITSFHTRLCQDRSRDRALINVARHAEEITNGDENCKCRQSAYSAKGVARTARKPSWMGGCR